MSRWVIVAIPEKEDLVWKLSSEQIPHMTILNLGEQEMGPQAAKITGYLEHAVETMLCRFRMSVDHRGTLGPQDADVLFFDKGYCEKQVKEFREALLKNPDILELYNGAEQFPDWVPHLTLGFPETPAHPDTRDYTDIYSVGFGKIALWVNDFDGPEIELQSREGSDLLMSDVIDTVEIYNRNKVLLAFVAGQGASPGDLLQATGRAFDESKVKRKGGRFASKAEGSGDAGWMNPEHLRNLHSKILMASSADIIAAKKAVLKKYGLKPGDDITKHPKAQRELLTNTVTILNKAAKTMGVSPSGNARINFAVNKDGTGIYKSAVLNNNAHRVGGRKVVPSAKHSVEDIPGISLDQKVSDADALQFGRIGQKWGVVHPRGADGKVNIEGRPIKKTLRTIKRQGGVHTLSSEDLQKLTTRINLENNYADAVARASKTKAVNAKVRLGLDLGKTANDAIKFYNSDAGQLIRASVGKDSHAGKHNKLSQPLGKLVADLAPAVGGKGGGKRKKK